MLTLEPNFNDLAFIESEAYTPVVYRLSIATKTVFNLQQFDEGKTSLQLLRYPARIGNLLDDFQT